MKKNYSKVNLVIRNRLVELPDELEVFRVVNSKLVVNFLFNECFR